MLDRRGEELMPEETKKAVEWALKQCFMDDVFEVCVVDKRSGKVDEHWCVDFVTRYFNDRGIDYSSFYFSDIQEFIPEELLN